MEFQAFRATEAEKSKLLEQRIRKAREGEARTRDAETLVSQKIEERLLGRNLHPFVKDLLYGPWHKFMVVLVLKEGPGSNAWKQAINTIDVLLWSIQSHEQPGDRQRLARELQQETVRVISDGLLFNRALLSVNSAKASTLSRQAEPIGHPVLSDLCHPDPHHRHSANVRAGRERTHFRKGRTRVKAIP